MKKLLPIGLVLCLFTACESSPPAKKTSTDAVDAPAKQVAPVFDGERLLRQAQLLRDREFPKAPTFEADADFKAPRWPGCAATCEAERRDLVDVLFNGTTTRAATRLAYWSPTQNAVIYDPAATDQRALQAHILSALVEGLDQSTGAKLAAADSWDGYVTRRAIERGPGVFVAALEAAKAEKETISAADLAMRPDVLPSLVPTAFIDRFSTREGFAFTAAMYRAGGWSAVELSRTDPPVSSTGIVRPDRYFEGLGVGTWTWPTEVTEDRTNRGFMVAREGRVGAAVFVEWLSTHIPAAIAHAAYLGFETDRYRLWKEGDNWVWEWVALWNTPSNAQQVVEVLDAGLRKQTGRHFTVLRKGVIVAVVGSSQPLPDDGMRFAPLLVDMRPQFPVGRSVGLAFTPTPADQLLSRELVEGLAPGPWTDEVTGASMNLGSLDDWKLLPTKEAVLPWVAKREADDATIQLLIELPSFTGPEFASDTYRDAVAGKFGETMELQGEAAVIRVEEPAPGTLQIDATGRIKDRPGTPMTKTRAWQFATGPYLVTLSVQAAPDGFDTALADATALLESVELPAAPPAADGGGVIKFEVEE